MSNKVYQQENLIFYGERASQLIPLNVWDAVDDHGRERGKSPRDKDWTTIDYSIADIEGCIDRGGNIGYRMDQDELVVDLDPRNMDRSLVDACDYLARVYGLDVGEAPTVETGSGGLHIYFKIPERWIGKKFINEMDELPGVEFKGFGRQVVSPGSKHPNGTFYATTDDMRVPEAPFVTDQLMAAIERIEISADIVEGTLSLAELETMLSVLDPHDYASNDEWLKIAMACHAATGGEGLDIFLTWSLQDGEYADQEGIIRERWASFQSAGITAATLYREVSRAGSPELLRPSAQKAFEGQELSSDDVRLLSEVKHTAVLFERGKDGRPKRTVENVKIGVEALGLIPRRNQLSDDNFIEGDKSLVKDYFPTVATAVDDDLLHGVRAALTSEFRFEPSLAQVSEGISALALLRPFHPIREFLADLEWDGIDRISDFFPRYCGTTQSPYVSAVGETMFKAAVARVMRPGIKYDTMVILEGTQGCGKSTLVQILGGDWSLEGIPNKSDLNHKDVIQAIQGAWVVEVEELAVMRKSDVDSMKAFLTRTTDRARFAYARESKDYPRQCIFIGTTNDDEYLLDSTGNRRFLPIQISSVNLPQLRDDRDQIWAQAYVLWNQKPTPQALMLPESLWGQAANEQSIRRVQDPLEFKLKQYLDGVPEDIGFISQSKLLFEGMAKLPQDADMSDLRRIGRAIQAVSGWKNDRREVEGAYEKGVSRS